MKVTILLPTSPRKIGGGTKVLYEYANYLADRGHAVEIAHMADRMFLKFHFPEPIRRLLVRCSVAYRPRWFKLNKKIKKYPVFTVNDKTIHDADAIIATAVCTPKHVAKLSTQKGKKFYFIQDYENWDVSDAEVQATYRLGLINITVSKWLSGLVHKYSGIEPICLTNGINTRIFYTKTKINNRKPHSVVFQYRSNTAKGGKYAIEVCNKIKKMYPDTEINVISNEKKPPEMPDSFNFYYNVSQEGVADINNRSVVFICTTIDEGFGLPGLEAMACGCAVASTAYTGVFEYAVDGENALLSPPKDVEAMVNNIVRIFEDEQLRNKLSENGAKTGEERSFINSAKKFEDILMKNIYCPD